MYSDSLRTVSVILTSLVFQEQTWEENLLDPLSA